MEPSHSSRRPPLLNQVKPIESTIPGVKDSFFSSNQKKDSLFSLMGDEKKVTIELEKPIEAKKSNEARVWDCGSSLYDSFELNSFKRELDSAISCRTMSMPHLSDRRAPPPHQQPSSSFVKKTHSSRLSRSLNKFLRSVFKPRSSSKTKEGTFYLVYDKSGSGGLTTIPEVVAHEFGGLSPEIGAAVRRTGSERFSSTASIGISCA